jgi:peptide subunit release factor 1 (eRF1)
MTSTTSTAIDALLDRLSEYEQASAPVVSLYLDLSADQHGREQYRAFVQQAFGDELQTYPAASAERRSLEQMQARVLAYVADEVPPAVESVAVFACDGEPPLFEAIQLEVPLDGHRLYVDRRPHLFPLARLHDQYTTCAAVLVNTNTARIHLVAVGTVQRAETVRSEKVRKVSGGGWSQARFQRHTSEAHQRHMKEAAEALTRLVDEERLSQVLIAGDDQAVAMLQRELPPRVADVVVDVLRLDIRTPEHEVAREVVDTLRRRDAELDRDVVQAAIGAYRSGGLGTIGLARVQAALELGQVDRLLVPAAPAVSAGHTDVDVTATVPKEQASRVPEPTVEALVAAARRTDATVTFIEDAALLAPAGGVAALLRFRV